MVVAGPWQADYVGARPAETEEWFCRRPVFVPVLSYSLLSEIGRFVNAWSLNDVLAKSTFLGYLEHLNLRITKADSLSWLLSCKKGDGRVEAYTGESPRVFIRTPATSFHWYRYLKAPFDFRCTRSAKVPGPGCHK